MGSLIHDLQKAILDPNQSLTQLLRQTKLIAAKLNLEDVEKWADLELNGYDPSMEPPKYREFTIESLITYNPYLKGWEYISDLHETLRTHMPIAQIEDLSKKERLTYPLTNNVPLEDNFGESVGSKWPQRVTTSGMKFKNILEEVRNELLEWTTRLEKKGIKGEGMNFDEKEKQLATSVHIETFTGVFGNVTNSQVAIYDYSSVHQLLVDRQIPKEGRRELEDILDELKTATPVKKPSLIEKGEKWIVKHKDFLGAAADVFAKVIKGTTGHAH